MCIGTGRELEEYIGTGRELPSVLLRKSKRRNFTVEKEGDTGVRGVKDEKTFGIRSVITNGGTELETDFVGLRGDLNRSLL